MTVRPAVIGGFVLGAIALAVAGTLFFGGAQFFTKKATVVVFFEESLAGLDIGAPVTFSGVRIGSVKSISIRFLPDHVTALTPVFLELEGNRITWEGKELGNTSEEIARQVLAGLRAQLALQSFVTGQLRVDLDFHPGTPANIIAPPGNITEIPAIPSEIAQLRNKLTELPLPELATTTMRSLAALERLSSHLDAKLDPLTGSVQRTADTATQTLQTIGEAVRALQPEALTTLRDLESALVEARHELEVRGTEIGRTLAAAERASRQAETLLGSVNTLAQPGSRTREDLQSAIRDLADAASSLRAFANTVERDPNALLLGRRNR